MVLWLVYGKSDWFGPRGGRLHGQVQSEFNLSLSLSLSLSLIMEETYQNTALYPKGFFRGIDPPALLPVHLFLEKRRKTPKHGYSMRW
jgi:hypothetical protein